MRFGRLALAINPVSTSQFSGGKAREVEVADHEGSSEARNLAVAERLGLAPAPQGVLRLDCNGPPLSLHHRIGPLETGSGRIVAAKAVKMVDAVTECQTHWQETHW